MKILQGGVAGTFESSDIHITIEPDTDGIEISLQSSVEKQFGEHIRKEITNTLKNLKIDNVQIHAIDNGALDCVIRARVECAAYRAAQMPDKCNWEEIDKWTI